MDDELSNDFRCPPGCGLPGILINRRKIKAFENLKEVALVRHMRECDSKPKAMPGGGESISLCDICPAPMCAEMSAQGKLLTGHHLCRSYQVKCKESKCHAIANDRKL